MTQLVEPVTLLEAHGEYVRVAPPVEGEEQFISDLKMFIFSCLARRNMDDDFEGNMYNWMQSVSEEDFRARSLAIKRQ